MAVTAYLLIQTEVGKAAHVVDAIRDITASSSADDVTGPYDVIVRDRGRQPRRPRQDGRLEDPGGRGHHPHRHLPRRPPLTRGWVSRGGGRRGRAAGVAVDREGDEAVEQLGVREPGRLPELRVHRDRREPGDRVQLVDEEAPARLLEEEVDPRHAPRSGTPRTRAAPAPAPRRCARRRAGRGCAGPPRRPRTCPRRCRTPRPARSHPAATPRVGRRRARRPRSRGPRRPPRPRPTRRTSRARSIAASSSARSCALLTPTDEPMFAGLTKHGSPSSATTCSANPARSSPSRSAR